MSGRRPASNPSTWIRQPILWSLAVATAAGMLVASDFRSRDPDSALYARLAAELAQQSPARWIAPEWGGAWNQHGPFREHPVGILIPSVLLMRAGVPDGQAPYIVNFGYQVAVILLIALVARAIVTGLEARTLAWLLQLLPVSFAYRIRANQEHPLLMCFLALLYGAHRARTQPAWVVLMVLSFCCLVLVKGAFAMFALVAAALWLLVVPAPAGSDGRAWAGLAAAVIAAVLMLAAYEAIYVRTTGESFLDFYRSTRLGQSISLSDPRVVSHALGNVVWYLGRLLWFAAPWSLLAVAVAGVWARSKAGRGSPAFDRLGDRGLQWALLVTAVFVAVLSPALVRAERFIFPCYFIIGAVGVVAAMRNRPSVHRFMTSADRYTWLPIAIWFITFLLSLASKALR